MVISTGLIPDRPRTLALQHHGQLLRAAVAALRWNVAELKCQRLENQLFGIEGGLEDESFHYKTMVHSLERPVFGCRMSSFGL